MSRQRPTLQQTQLKRSAPCIQTRPARRRSVLRDALGRDVRGHQEKAAALYRVPAAENGAPAQMQKIKTLTGFAEKITGAASASDGRRVALRTHTQLAVFTATDLVSPRRGQSDDQSTCQAWASPQGEGVAFGEGGTIFSLAGVAAAIEPGRCHGWNAPGNAGSLVRSQRDERIDARGAERRQVARAERRRAPARPARR